MRYELLEEIGSGGMGTVYVALDRLTGEQVALKRVRVRPDALLFNSRGDGTELRLALAQEFRTLAGLRHPNIISVLDYGFDAEGLPFYTMPLLKGAISILDAANGQALETKILLLIQLLHALSYLHRRRILHRDLKPSNVLVIEGEVMLLDFGLAVEGDHRAGLTGTVAYMAPEVLGGRPPTERADLFAAGLIAYQMFTGRYPYDADKLYRLIKQIMTQPPNLATLPTMEDTDLVETVLLPPTSPVEAPTVKPMTASSPLAIIVGRLLERDPQRRYASAPQVIRDLTALIGKPLLVEPARQRESYLQGAPFVGRAPELGALVNALHEMLAGRGGGWLVGGESGVGKTRLLDELRVRALVAGALVVSGHELERSVEPYRAWRNILRRLLLGVSKQQTDSVMPHLGRILGRPLPHTSPANINRAIVQLFEAQRQPVVLLLEDLQWANETIPLLRRLLSLADRHPLLIVADYRSEERADLPRELPFMEHLHLNRLDDHAVANLSRSMLGEAGTRPDVLELLHRETEGNVYFLIEVVRALAEEVGSLDEIGRTALPESVLSGGIRQFIRRRLEQVPDWAYGSLQVAAVAGRELDLRVLDAALSPLLALITPDSATSSMLSSLWRESDGLTLNDWLVECADKAILEVRDNQWRFTHEKLREYLLEEMTPQQAAFLHQQIAAAIEKTYPNDPRFDRILAAHWRLAGDADRAAIYEGG